MSGAVAEGISSGAGASVVLPGGTVGLLGGGQLGRMFALEAWRMGYRVRVFDPSAGCPAGQVAESQTTAEWSDEAALREFASGVDVVTYEFENIPVAAIEVVSERCPVFPRGEVLHVCQNREREKLFLKGNGFPCADFWVVDSPESLASAMAGLGANGGVLKTADFGYDGKGQVRVKAGDDAAVIWEKAGGVRGVLEGWMDFEKEFSMVCARGRNGEIAVFPVIENVHRNHILDRSLVPGRVPDVAQRAALKVARGIVERLDVVGVIAVECFLLKDGSVVVNEMAPRPHNSGHFSFDACVTSQFEQQLRAVCGLPLGKTDLLRPVVMANLLGDLWADGEPDWTGILRDPAVKLHLYGKKTPRPGRKMGHICALGETLEDALECIDGALGEATR